MINIAVAVVQLLCKYSLTAKMCPYFYGQRVAPFSNLAVHLSCIRIKNQCRIAVSKHQ